MHIDDFSAIWYAGYSMKVIFNQTCLPTEMTWGKNDYNLGEDFEM